MTRTHLNTEGGSLQETPSGGRGNLNTSTTGNYCRRTLGRRGDCSGSAETKDGTVGRSIRHSGRTFEGVAKGGDKVKIPRHGTLGQTC